MNELKKYIVVFDIVAFLGFSKKFTTRLKKFTTLKKRVNIVVYINSKIDFVIQIHKNVYKKEFI